MEVLLFLLGIVIAVALSALSHRLQSVKAQDENVALRRHLSAVVAAFDDGGGGPVEWERNLEAAVDEARTLLSRRAGDA